LSIQRTQRIHAVAPRLAVDDASERPDGQPRYPSDAATEPGEEAPDIELAAAHPDFEKSSLIEALRSRR